MIISSKKCFQTNSQMCLTKHLDTLDWPSWHITLTITWTHMHIWKDSQRRELPKLVANRLLESFLSADINLFLKRAKCPWWSFLELENIRQYLLFSYFKDSVNCSKSMWIIFQGCRLFYSLGIPDALTAMILCCRTPIPSCSIKRSLVLNELNQKFVMPHHLTSLIFIFPFSKIMGFTNNL